MRTVYILLTGFCIFSFACSKSSGKAQLDKKEPDVTVSKPSSLTDKSKEYHTMLIGTWRLVKQLSDMGPVSWPSSYRRTLSFDSTFFYTDSTLYNPENVKIVTYTYKIEVKEPTGPGYNPYIFLNTNNQGAMPKMGVFTGVAHDTLSIFNGVGTEYYIRAVPQKK